MPAVFRSNALHEEACPNFRLAVFPYSPPVDVFLPEALPVQLRPGADAVQPRHHVLGRPASHGLPDQWVVLLSDATAPVIHQDHDLKPKVNPFYFNIVTRNVFVSFPADG